jgi:hypothetical protein
MSLSRSQRLHRDLCWAAYEWIDRAGNLHIGYEPSAEQLEIHNCSCRFKLIAGGVGAGKSLLLAREGEAYTAIKNGLGWIIGPIYELALPEFDYILAVARLLEIVDESTVSRPVRGSARFKTLWGFEWVTKSSEKLEELAGRRPNVILVTEAAQHPPGILSKVYERSAENRAPIIFGGTFEKGYGWYGEQWDRWQGDNPEGGRSFSLPTWTNLAIYPGGRSDPEILKQEALMPPDLFMERYGGVPCKPSGLVFKEFDRSIHTDAVDKLYDPLLPVELAIDPGVHCYSVLFVQRQRDGKTVHILDEVYAKDVIGQQVIPLVVANKFWEHSCKFGVMDIYGQRRQGANVSQVEVWQQELAKMNQHPVNLSSVPILDVSIWYQQIHLRLWNDTENSRPPLLKFASHLNDTIGEDGVANGIVGELKTHRWPSRSELQASAHRPLKKNDDALSALGYYLVYYFGPVEERKQPTIQTIRRYF